MLDDSIKLDNFNASSIGPKENISEGINTYLNDSSIPEYQVKVNSGSSGMLMIAVFIGAAISGLLAA